MFMDNWICVISKPVIRRMANDENSHSLYPLDDSMDSEMDRMRFPYNTCSFHYQFIAGKEQQALPYDK